MWLWHLTATCEIRLHLTCDCDVWLWHVTFVCYMWHLKLSCDTWNCHVTLDCDLMEVTSTCYVTRNIYMWHKIFDFDMWHEHFIYCMCNVTIDTFNCDIWMWYLTVTFGLHSTEQLTVISSGDSWPLTIILVFCRSSPSETGVSISSLGSVVSDMDDTVPDLSTHSTGVLVRLNIDGYTYRRVYTRTNRDTKIQTEFKSDTNVTWHNFRKAE